MEHLTYWYPGSYGGYREVGGDGRVMEKDGVEKTVSVYLPYFEPSYFVLEATGLMHADGVTVAECYAEEFIIDDATRELTCYRRTMYSLTKSEKGWCIYESRVERLIEYNVINSNHVIDSWRNGVNSQGEYRYQSEAEDAETQNTANQAQSTANVDEEFITSWLDEYIHALFTEDEIYMYHHEIYYSTGFESQYNLINLPRQLGEIKTLNIFVESYTTDMSEMGYVPEIFEQADYKPVQAKVSLMVYDNDGTLVSTTNRLLLVMVDGQYRLADDVQI